VPSPTIPAPGTRCLGLVSATALVVANMVGTGVFTTSGFLLADLKSPWPVLVCGGRRRSRRSGRAQLWGPLARRLPESGGEYLFLSRHPASSLGYVAGGFRCWWGFRAPGRRGPWPSEPTRALVPRVAPQFLGTVLILVFSALHAANGPSGRVGAKTPRCFSKSF